MSNSNVVEVKRLNVDYGNFKLKDIELTIPKGMIVGFVGENGAGKTTTLKSILRVVPEASGSVCIFGEKIDQNSVAHKQKIASILDDTFFYEKFTVQQISNILKLEYENWDQHYLELRLEKAKIDIQQTFEKLSKGMKMKVKMYCALASNPQLLLLDEPTSGLDPVSRDDMLREIQEFMIDEEKAVLFSSHITTDIEKIADYVIFISDGGIVTTLEMDTFKNEFGLVKLTQQQVEDLGEFPYIYYRKSDYAHLFLIENRQYFVKEYPDLVCEKATIEDVLIMIERGEKA